MSTSLEKVTIKTPKTMGCSLVSTVVFQALKKRFSGIHITIVTNYPELFRNNQFVDNIVAEVKEGNLDIDLFDYLNRKGLYNDNITIPIKHLATHQLEEVENQLKLNEELPRNFKPVLYLTSKEIGMGESIAKELSNGKPIVWLQTESSVLEKKLPAGFWEKLIELNPQFTFVDLSSRKYNPRISAAITLFCEAGITLDTFMSHASRAVGAKNVLVLLSKKSSHSGIVAYPDQIILDGRDDKTKLTPENVSCVLSEIISKTEIILKIWPSDLIFNNDQSDLIEDEELDGNISNYELDIINNIIRIFKPKNIFEFGTFDGRTTINMAVNAPEDSKVFTLDIPSSMITNVKFGTYRGVDRDGEMRDDLRYIQKGEIGSRCKNKKGSEKIHQLLGDSASFDYSPFERKMDFIFIDGSHAKDYVSNDTEAAMKMASDNCLILWHDYGNWEDVTSVLNCYFVENGRFEKMRLVKGTRLVLLKNQ